jgi:hypothetical protein
MQNLLKSILLPKAQGKLDLFRNISTALHLVFLRSVSRLLVTENVVHSSPIPVTSMIEALDSCETSFLTTVTRRNIPEDDILHSQSSENLKSYMELTGCAL